MTNTLAEQSVNQSSPSTGALLGSISAEGWLTISLDGRLTINEVESWQPELINALAQSDHLVLDPSNLDAVDMAGVQLLVALRASAAQAGKTLRWGTAPRGTLRTVLVSSALTTTHEGPPNLGDDPFWCGKN
ncbi:hypothetical protein CCP3SC1_220020 [Gammaproteobacteria bacterium]